MQVLPESFSNKRFKIFYENSFQVFPNKNAVIGIHQTSNRLLYEDFSLLGHHSVFGEHECQIMTVLLTTNYRVFAGDSFSSVVEYDLKPGKSFGKILRKYRNLDIDLISSSGHFKNIVAFGGDNGLVRLIDTKTSRLLDFRIESNMKSVLSIGFLEMNNQCFYLCVTGTNPSFGNSKADIFDVSDLFR